MRRPFRGALYHGSRCFFEDGFILLPQSHGYVHDEEVREFEQLVDSRRPDGCLSRFSSVFLSADPALIDGAGGYVDAVYRVEPLSAPQVSDLAWYSEAWCEYSAEPRDERRILELIDGYWSGEPFPEREVGNFEYRVIGAQVVEMVELNVELGELEVPAGSPSFVPADCCSRG